MDFSQVLTCAVDLGEEMLISGGEVYRVEDCIRRICLSYGAVRAEVFVLTASIVATLEQPDGRQMTQTDISRKLRVPQRVFRLYRGS